MADVYGNIVTTNDMARFLKDMNRDYYGRKTWEQAFGNIDLAEQQQIGSLGYDYSKAIGEAYAAAYKNQQGIMASNLGQGYKEQAMISNEEALNQAFETYRQNYLSGVSKVETEANKARTELGEQLNTQAENVAKLMNAPFGSEDKEGYVQWLFGQADTDEKLKTYIEGNPTFERYFKETDAGKELKDSYELRQMLRNEQGYLSKEGTNIYDQLFNLGATVGDKYSFGRWLAESDKDLYDWANKSDVYNFTVAGTNLGTIKELVGMSSTDRVYDYIDMLTGLPKEQIETIQNDFKKFTDSWNERLSQIENFDMNNASNRKQLEDYYNQMSGELETQVNNLKTFSEKIGLTELIKDNKDWTTLFNSLNNALNKLKNRDNDLDLRDVYKESGKELSDKPFFKRLYSSVWEFIKAPFEWASEGSKKSKEDLPKFKEDIKELENIYNSILIQLANTTNQLKSY